jgi:zinc protease
MTKIIILSISVALLILLFLVVPPHSHAANSPSVVEMKNGITIITDEIKDSPLVSINVFVRAGSKNEKPGQEGITHFSEHLFFRGTTSASGSEFKSSLEALGGLCNAETTKDYTRYYINIPSRHAMQGLQLLIDALQNNSYDEREIEQERKVIIEEYKMTGESSMSGFHDALCDMAYPDHPYRQPIIGKEKTIKRFKRADFLEFRRQFYTPERLVFVIVGNFNTDRATDYINQVYGSATSTGRGEEKPVPEPSLKEPREKIIQKGYDNTFLLMGYYGPSARDKEHIYATDVLCFMLGNGKSSMLNRELVEKKDILKDINVNFLTQKDPGLITIFAVLKSPKVDDARKEIKSVFQKAVTGEFSDDELKRAKNLLVNSYMFGNETNDGKASSIGFYEILDNYRFASTYVQNIMAVKREDIMKAAKKYLEPPCCALIIKPQPKKKVEDDDE